MDIRRSQTTDLPVTHEACAVYVLVHREKTGVPVTESEDSATTEIEECMISTNTDYRRINYGN